jgi:lipopolysaccharide/colanic/teichoic acid biosynthesis glycosyltransferase
MKVASWILHPSQDLPEQGASDRKPPASVAASAKRLYDLALSAGGLVVLSPLFLVVAALVKAADGGPVFFRQERIGWRGQPFRMWKFRSMVPRADANGRLVTSAGDPRITRFGRLLRKTKLDELPQLWNVLKGEMSLVGPRPEVAKYARRYTPEQRQILDLKPGITDLASLHFRNEELLLQHADNVEDFYVRYCLPKKAQLNLEYAAKANLLSDTWLIFQTICPYWLCVLSVYCLVLAAAFWLSCLLLYGFRVPAALDRDLAGILGAFVAVQLGALIWRKQCKGLLSYFSLPELRQIATALGVSCLVLLGASRLAQRQLPPQNLVILDSLVALCALGGFRLVLRYWRESFSVGEAALDHPPLRVGIVGAGTAGSQLACELMFQHRYGRRVVAFFDDDSQKWHHLIHNIPVVGMPECLSEDWAGKLDEVIIAMPMAPLKRIQEIGRLVHKLGLRVCTAPSADQLLTGGANPSPGEKPL